MKIKRITTIKTRDHRFIATMFCMLLSFTGCRAKKAEESSSPPPDAPSRSLPSDPPREEIAALLAEAQSPDFLMADNADNVALVKRIGATKSPEAIPFLIENMMKIGPIEASTSFQEQYTCSAALVEIGEPAVPYIQARLLEVESGHEQLLWITTLREIKGKEYAGHWLESLPEDGLGALTKERRSALKEWVTSGHR